MCDLSRAGPGGCGQRVQTSDESLGWLELAPTASSALARLHADHLARNVPLSSSAEFNPVLSRTSLLGRFIETWERIFVLCYRESCAVHTPTGAADGRRMWWPEVQQRVVVFDAADIDRQNINIVRWAGCDLPNRTAGRSGEPATSEPCIFNRRAGGVDWRRTSKHRLLALMAHLTLVETAARLNLSRVLILEADVVPTLAVEELSRDPSVTLDVARQMGRAFATHPWSVARLSGMFYSKEFAPVVPGGRRSRRSCSRKCSCQHWAGSEVMTPIKSHPRMPMCEVAAAPNPSDRITSMLEALHSWCDVRDTAAYAVHSSAFPAFVAYLRRLRALPAWLHNNAIDVPAIDNWLPHAFPCVYVLPTLVTQPTTANGSQGATGLMRQTSARNFMQYCARDGEMASEERQPPVSSGHRPMKLSSFATRHLYVMRVEDIRTDSLPVQHAAAQARTRSGSSRDAIGVTRKWRKSKRRLPMQRKAPSTSE